MIKGKNTLSITLLLLFSFMCSLAFPCLNVWAEDAAAFHLFTDIQGHWAEKQIKTWAGKDLIGGYPNGIFCPNNNVTRAEFLALVNRAFGYTGSVQGKYNDVSETDWFYGEVDQAEAIGYLSVLQDEERVIITPNVPISREEVAAIFNIILPYSDINLSNTISSNTNTKAETAVYFTDQFKIPVENRVAVNKAVCGGYMGKKDNGNIKRVKDNNVDRLSM